MGGPPKSAGLRLQYGVGIDSQQLAAAVAASKTAGGITPELYGFVVRIVRVMAWDCRSEWVGDRDDLTQEVALKVHTRLGDIDPGGNPFWYISQITRDVEKEWNRRTVQAARSYRQIADLQRETARPR